MLPLLPLALAADPPAETGPDGRPIPTEEIVIHAESRVATARAQVFQDLRDLGYRKGQHRDDHTVFKSRTPYEPQVLVYDDGWIRLRRQPPRFRPPGEDFADEADWWDWIWCVPTAMTACVAVGGIVESPARLNAQREEVIDATREGVKKFNDAVARRELILRVNEDVPRACEEIWADTTLPPAARRWKLLLLWDSRTDTPEGREVQKAVEAFMHGVVNQSETPFTPSEVADFNARRVFPEPIDLGPLPK